MNLPSTAKAVRRALWGLLLAAVIGIGLTIPALAAAGALSVPSGPVSPDSDDPLVVMAASANAQGSISAFVTVSSLDSDDDGFPDSTDGCPATPTVWPTPIGDDDCDGWTADDEIFIGTDPNLACGPGAWPPDFDDNQIVDIFDVSLMSPPVFFSVSGDANYSARLDINPDGIIDIFDIALLAPPIFFVTCTP
ncbi:MAG: hypothetical protein V3S20_10980 [Dehalococcoidia bacterium]